jgi:hypothetical protein
MVEIRTNQPRSATSWGAGRTSLLSRAADGMRSMRTRRASGVVIGMVTVALASGAMAMSTSGGARSEGALAPRPTSSAAMHVVDAAGSGQVDKMNKAVAATAKEVSPAIVPTALPAPVATTTTQPAATPTPTTVPTTQPAAPAPAPPAVTPAADPAITTLVAQVEASGIDPGSNWSWSMGDTATHCAAMSGTGTACTYGTGGGEFTIFAGSPNLALVAHELANAETQNDAVPTLMNEVATAEGGTSWSPTDAVASCLVEHFMGFQDDVAGTWQCSAILGDEVAAHIHDGS